MGERVELVIDPLRRERVSIELPLAYRVPVESVRSELGLPDSVDLSDPIVARAVALAGAAKRQVPGVRFAVFGGVAHRLRCAASNRASLGLRHELHDLDIAIRLDEVRSFERFLRGVAAAEGSGLTFFETPGDRIFNSLSGGQRLRWHMVVGQQDSEVALGTLDIVADEFSFCHRFDVRDDVEAAPRNGWTLSPAHLLLAKGQFIQRIPKSESVAVSDRVLEPFGKHDVVIGPESKDVRDLLALLHDHALGEGPGEISPRLLERRLRSDWGLWKTIGLNLGMVGRSKVLAAVPDAARAQIRERLDALTALVAPIAPKRRFGFLGGPWWQEVDSTPSVDTTVAVG